MKRTYRIDRQRAEEFQGDWMMLIRSISQLTMMIMEVLTTTTVMACWLLSSFFVFLFVFGSDKLK